MKFGCCLNMVAGTPDGTGLERLEEARRAGFDYVELPLAELTALETTQFLNIVERMRRSGPPCEACNNFFPRDIRLTGPGAERAAALDYARNALGRAAALGAKTVVFGSGPAKTVPEGFPIEEGWRQVAELLRELAPLAEEHGMIIAIEPLRRVECNLVNTYREGCALAEAVDRPQVRVLVDYYHLCQENEPEAHVRAQGRWLSHVHLARPEGRGYPGTNDGHDYGAFFAALEGAGYDGRISCEAYSQRFEQDARDALALLRARF